MSLTSHLKDKNSPVRRFLVEEFPNTAPIQKDAHVKLASASTVRPSAKVPYGTIGTALDYRIRYYFALTPMHELVAHSGSRLVQGEALRTAGGVTEGRALMSSELVKDFFASLEQTLPEVQPVGRRLEPPAEAVLNRYCVVLALFEEIFRAGPMIQSPLFSLQSDASLSDLLALAQGHWVDDLCALSWLFFDSLGDRLSHPFVLNPTFNGSMDVGGADADLILGHCLVDIKATVNPKLEPVWLYQLLGYVMLDYSDRYRMREVAVYMARQGVLLQWPLPTFLDLLTGHKAPPLSEFRERFQQVVPER